MSKFNIGDKFRVVGNSNYHGFPIGEIVRIVEPGGSDDWVAECLDKHNFWFVRETDIEPLVYPKIVITTDGTKTLARLYEGNKVVKSAEAKCSPKDTFDFVTGANLAYDRLMRPEALAKTEPKKDELKFKVGDKVKSVDGTCAGEIGTVIRVDEADHGTPYYVQFGSLASWKDVDYVEPYTEPEKPKYYSGKVVCVDSSIYPEYWTAGKVYTIVDGKIINDEGHDRYSKITSLEETSNWTSAKFIPFVES